MWGHLLQLIAIPEQIWTISGSPFLTITLEAGLKPASTNTKHAMHTIGHGYTSIQARDHLFQLIPFPEQIWAVELG